MAQIRVSFEKELRSKLQQKATARQSEEAVLKAAFKYFDLDDSGQVDKGEFIKAIEKIGIQIFNKQDFYDLFDFYDTDKSGELDYQEFTSIIFGNQSATTRQQTPSKQNYQQSQIAYSQQAYENIDQLLEKLRNKLKQRGANGILSIGKVFLIYDDDGSKQLNFDEFKKGMKDYQVGLTDSEIQTLFNYFDRSKDGTIDYDEFLSTIRGPMNNFRKKLVQQAFAKFDTDGSGEINVDDLKDYYNARNHPDVKAGKKTEQQVLNEFLSTFESHSELRGTMGDNKISYEEFEDYYTFVSASIDNDQYFELMMMNSWKLNEKMKKLPQAYQQQSQQSQKQQMTPQQYKQKGKNKNIDVNKLLDNIRARLKSRGVVGMNSLQKRFKIMDDDNDNQISFEEFAKAAKECNFGLNEEECAAIYDYIDRDGSNQLDIDELVRAFRGEMNQFRKNLVMNAFKILDKNGDGVLQVSDIKGVYNAKQHPEVRSGKKTEDQVLGEFLETFEMHHNIRGGSRDQNVTPEEFMEYYNNVSASIDNDQYFELMITNAFKPQQKNTQVQYSYKNEGDTSSNKNLQQAYDQYKSKTIANAPFGTSNQATDYSTNMRPQTGQSKKQQQQQAFEDDFKQPQQKKRQEQAKRAGKGVGGKQGGPSAQELLNQFREKIKARGGNGIFSIGRIFRIADDDNSKELSFSEFSKCVKESRLDLPQDSVQMLYNAFDLDQSGSINYDEFLRMIRGPMNQNRQKLVELAFKKLDANGNGIIQLDDVKQFYNAKNHPDVRQGKKTEDQVLGEFLDTFEIHHATLTGDIKMKDRDVTFEEFLEYYNNISCSIDDDRYFELMMKNAWKLN